MDLDAYSHAHDAEWRRLDELSRQRRFDGRDADELIDGYQAGATQLSQITTAAGQAPQAARLSVLLSRARLRFTGAAADPVAQFSHYATRAVPAALYGIRYLSLAVMAIFVAIAAAYAVWVATNPDVVAAIGDYEQLRVYAEQEFVDYYRESSEGVFATQVFTNNAWIAAQCVAFGITGLWPAFVLFQNAQGVGISAGIMAEFDRLDVFFLSILPHGQLELYAVFVACAAGLRIFWAWVAPGARTRIQALAEDGRALFATVGGLVVALLVSGVIEGVVTRQEWPDVIRIGIGTVALAWFLWVQWGLGRRAALAGETGDLDPISRGARVVVAD
ncbi:putative membrane protein SpoIIM required for sporulation [Microcella alkaliphila]|uniref:Putative membrane protein SpoIIM required for sporulation n=1 Tax=Microcella alkaliphila TaxID=279828 RepID=A0A4Q7TCB3_9MICO|nr:stage II sporulation protein M [Microcella alkaliphila]RZT58076.1 putative membrane protein SpoIIM required for sporulation [Microcella alkaliphila]